MAKKPVDEARDREDVAALESLRQRWQKGYRIEISRRSALGKDYAWVADWSGDNLPETAQIAEQFGGGDFQVEMRNATGVYVGRAKFSVEGPPKIPAAPAASTSVDATVKFALETMRETVKERSKEGGPDWTPVIAAAVTGGFALMAKLLERGGASDTNDPVRLLREVNKLRDELREPAGAGSSEGVWGPVIAGLTELGRQLGKIAEQKDEQPAAPGQLAPGSETGEDMDWRKTAADYVEQLAALCDKGRNPETYAEVVLDQAEEGAPRFYAELTDRLAAPEQEYRGFCDQFFGLYPQAAQRREWFQELFDAARELVTAEPEQPAAPETPAAVKPVASAEGTPAA